MIKIFEIALLNPSFSLDEQDEAGRKSVEKTRTSRLGKSSAGSEKSLKEGIDRRKKVLRGPR
jgi:hypothetical protein